MIVVTGSCRTGTSLAMQSLLLMGIPVTGDKWAEHLGVPESFNPKGFWDLPLEKTICGIHDNKYRGKAVKLFGWQLLMTDPDLVTRLIVCTRNKPDAVASTLRLLQVQTLIPGVPATVEVAEQVYEDNYNAIEIFRRKCPVMHIDYDAITSPETCEKELLALKKFVSAPNGVGAAIDNVEWRGVCRRHQQS